MLLERINHYHNLPFSIGFSNVACEAPHYHKETEIALVLRGNAKYKIYHQEYSLKEGDIIIADSHDLHYICDSSDDVIFLTSYIDMAYFDDIFPNIDFMIFACEEFSNDPSVSHQKIQNKIAFITHHLAEMMVLTAARTTDDQLLKEKLLDIVNTMVNHLQGFFIENNEFRYGGDDVNPLNLKRLARIISYLYTNYDRNITLADLAALEHLSIYHISHLIKETSGLSFQKLLNYIRLEYAEKLLNNEKTTLTQISELCGFSSPAYFNKCFREWYHMTPAQYRKQPRPSSRISHGNIDIDEAMTLLIPYTETKLPGISYGFSRQISIRGNTDETEQRNLRGRFPLNISINTCEELEELLHHKDELSGLLPRSICVSESVMADPAAAPALYSLEYSGIPISKATRSQQHRIDLSANTPAEALTNMLTAAGSYIRIRGGNASLIAQNGLPTPYYSFYKAVASADGLLRMHDGYMTVESAASCSAILYNEPKGPELKFHMDFKDMEMPPYFITRTFSGNSSVLYSLSRIDENFSDHRIKKQIFEFASGAVNIISSSLLPHNRLDITVSPGDIVVVTFSSSKYK